MVWTARVRGPTLSGPGARPNALWTGREAHQHPLESAPGRATSGPGATATTDIVCGLAQRWQGNDTGLTEWDVQRAEGRQGPPAEQQVSALTMDTREGPATGFAL